MNQETHKEISIFWPCKMEMGHRKKQKSILCL